MKTDIDSTKEFIKSNKTILKIQQRFKNERHTVFTADGTSKYLVSDKW